MSTDRPNPMPSPADAAQFVARTPGVADILRLFPSPSLAGRGRLSVEGGVSVVGGPGMGKSVLLGQLARRLDEDRSLATALVEIPPSETYPGHDRFYAFLHDLTVRLRDALAASPRLAEPVFAPVARALASEPVWDGTTPGEMSPRGFAAWIATVSAAATQTPGICLLFDDVDRVCAASWKDAFVAGLRFTFQTTAGITPVYAIWNLFADEALPGSNYFRNVTRPMFLEPLSSARREGANGPSERRALVELDRPGLRDEAVQSLFALAGGHPQLLRRCLGDVTTDGVPLAFPDAAIDAQRALARSLVARTPGLDTALRDLASRGGTRTVSKRLLATGFVDLDANRKPAVPRRVAEIL